MTSFTLTANSTTPRTLTDGEFGIVERGVRLVTAGDAIAVEGAVLVRVFGTVTGIDRAIVATDADLSLVIGPDARLASETRDTVRAFTSSSDVRNAGRIIAQEDALELRGTDVEIRNTGRLAGVGESGSDGIVVSTSAGASIFNRGTISGRDQGINSLEGDTTLVNRGTLSGLTQAYSGSDDRDSITNFGTITGEVRLEGSVDTVVNSGEMGRVVLGGGEDSYSGPGRGSAERVFAGPGADVLVGSRAGDVFHGGTGDDVFQFLRNGGDDRILDFSDGDVIGLGALGLDAFRDIRTDIRTVANGVLIDLDQDFGLTIRLVGVTRAEVGASDFTFDLLT